MTKKQTVRAENPDEKAMRLEQAQKNHIELNDTDKVWNALGLTDLITNANEVVHTTQTGYGKELVPLAQLSDSVLEMAIQESGLLAELPGNHGFNMGISDKVPIIGEIGMFGRNSEWTTGAPVGTQANKKTPTGEIQINQGQFIAQVALSKRMLNYSVADLEAYVKKALAQSAARTINAVILNGDATTASTGNVNSDDATPNSDSYYLELDNGIRKLALSDSEFNADLGALTRADFVTLEYIVDDLYVDGKDMLWLTNRRTYNKITTLDEYSDASKRGESSTLSGKAVANIDGADLLVMRDCPLTEADGKVSATTANNTKGGLHLLWKPAIQFGFGQPLEIDVTKVPGKGVQLTATFEFGFAIANKVAGFEYPSIASVCYITV